MTVSLPEIEHKFDQRLRLHLKRYYVDTLGLGRVEERIAYRFSEENVEQARLETFLEHIGWNKPLVDTRMLVVGSGWGGMVCAAQRMGINVSGLDVDADEIEISILRCLKNGLQPPDIINCPAEKMAFEDNTFNLVYCFSVIEHVCDVEKTLKEIYRVLKDDGYAYIQAPNYSIPWEGHYKMVLPIFLGKSLCKTILKLRGRNTEFLDTLNFTKKSLILNFLQRIGMPQLEEWNIANETNKKRPTSNQTFSSSSKSLIQRLYEDPDKYIGRVMFFIIKKFGLSNIYSICKKSKNKQLIKIVN